MQEILLMILIFLYSIGGIITFVWFVPTMVDLRKNKPSANIATYVVRSLTTLFTSLYGIFILQDVVFIIVINLQLLACVIVLLLRIRLHYISLKK